MGGLSSGTAHLLLLQGVVGYIALAQLLSWRARPAARLHRYTTAFCLAALVFMAGRTMQLGATDPARGLLGSRITHAAACGMALSWLGALRAVGVTLRPAALRRPHLLLGCALAALALLTPWIDAEPVALRTDLLGRRYHAPSPGPLLLLQLAWVDSVGLWSIWATRGARLEAGSEHEHALQRLTLFLAPLIVNEQLHVAGVIDSFFALEYGLAACAIGINLAASLRYQRIEAEQVELRKRFVEDVLQAQEEERRRIGRELHDEASQSLTSVLVGLHELEQTTGRVERQHRCHALQQTTRDTLDELGRLARGLHPQLLEDLGLPAAVERYAREFGGKHGVEVDVACVGLERHAVPHATATALYRVVQEALTNAVRHGHARHVSLVLQRDAGSMRITIEDDGSGFAGAPDATASTRGGLGLDAMRERVQLLGGTVEIDSVPGEGTTLTARVPLERSAAYA